MVDITPSADPAPVLGARLTLSSICVASAVILTLAGLSAVVFAHAAVAEVAALIGTVNTGLFALANGGKSS